MPPYRRPREVNHQPTKYDDCIIRATGKPYRHQAGSGRAAALAHIVDGMTIGQLTEITSGHGFDANFVVSSLLKQTGAKDCAYLVEPPAGKTMAELKGTRQARAKSPEALAKEAEKLEAAERKKAERAAAAEARAEAKAKADEERRAAKAARAEAAAAEAASKLAAAKEAAAKPADPATPAAEPAAAAPTKGKKGKKASPEADAEASANV